MSALMEVLEFLDNSGTVMVKRLPDNGPAEIKWGAQLTVRESQEVVFFKDGQVANIFQAGRYMLETKNIPEIGKWVTSFAYGPDSPFRAEVYFISKKIFTNLKWGTAEPILFKDSELKMVRLRSFGSFSIQITDSRLFMDQIVGSMGLYADSDIASYLKTIIVSKLAVVIGSTITSVLDMPTGYDSVASQVKIAVDADLKDLGLGLHDLYINSINIPEDVQKMIDERSGMSAIGNMDEFMKYKMAMSIQDAAKNSSGTGAQAISSGMGLGMGLLMPQAIQQAMATTNTTANTSEESPIEKLKQLKALFDAGILTQDEFDQKKTKLLALI